MSGETGGMRIFGFDFGLLKDHPTVQDWARRVVSAGQILFRAPPQGIPLDHLQEAVGSPDIFQREGDGVWLQELFRGTYREVRERMGETWNDSGLAIERQPWLRLSPLTSIMRERWMEKHDIEPIAGTVLLSHLILGRNQPSPAARQMLIGTPDTQMLLHIWDAAMRGGSERARNVSDAPLWHILRAEGMVAESLKGRRMAVMMGEGMTVESAREFAAERPEDLLLAVDPRPGMSVPSFQNGSGAMLWMFPEELAQFSRRGAFADRVVVVEPSEKSLAATLVSAFFMLKPGGRISVFLDEKLAENQQDVLGDYFDAVHYWAPLSEGTPGSTVKARIDVVPAEGSEHASFLQALSSSGKPLRRIEIRVEPGRPEGGGTAAPPVRSPGFGGSAAGSGRGGLASRGVHGTESWKAAGAGLNAAGFPSGQLWQRGRVSGGRGNGLTAGVAIFGGMTSGRAGEGLTGFASPMRSSGAFFSGIGMFSGAGVVGVR